MAAGGFKEFVAGETLDQDEINDFLMQGVLVFAGTAARGSAITAPVEGQFAFLKDDDALTFYDGTQWAELSTTPGAAVVGSTTGSPSITSGTVIGGTAYDIYSFTGSGSIVIDEAGFAEILTIGGGGGGGRSEGPGGGGAGGFLSDSLAYLPVGTAVVTVGGGGAGATVALQPAAPGFTSRLGFLFSSGGGVGAGQTINVGRYGASGGGGSSDDTSGAAGVAGLGFASGSGFAGGGGNRHGGGGGGASAVGTDASSGVSGNGGAGLASSITGTSVTRAGGGGGGPSGTGGAGGGGNGSSGTAGSGTVNSGSGGGGGVGTGGSGGSGIVIVRVAV